MRIMSISVSSYVAVISFVNPASTHIFLRLPSSQIRERVVSVPVSWMHCFGDIVKV